VASAGKTAAITYRRCSCCSAPSALCPYHCPFFRQKSEPSSRLKGPSTEYCLLRVPAHVLLGPLAGQEAHPSLSKQDAEDDELDR
jgi:hypothetical protein